MSNLLISFPDQSESFTYGVEYGRILARIENGEECITNNNFPVRIENLELLKQTCKLYGYIVTCSEGPNGWVSFMAIKRTTSDN